MTTLPTRLLTAAAALLVVSAAHAEDWTQFRGSRTDAVSKDATPPAEVGESNIVWTADLPGRGVSAPIVVGNKVLLTASSGYEQNVLQVLCFDDATGDPLWTRSFRATGRTMAHEKMAVATPTPCSDGERVYATFSSNDVVCLTLEGELVWVRGLTYDYPNASNSLGMSSSPVLAGGVLVVQVEADAEAFTVGLDRMTGKQLWKLDRPRKANWTSPALLDTEQGEKVVLQSSAGVSLVDPESGIVLGTFGDGASTIPSSTVSGGLIFTPSDGITVLKPTGTSELEEVWSASNLQPGTASPVVYQDRAYIVNRAGALAAARLSDGERLYQVRTKGPYSATPVAADGRLYLLNEKGLLQIVALPAAGADESEKAEVIDDHDFEATTLATPALRGNAIYLRSDKTLWKVSR